MSTKLRPAQFKDPLSIIVEDFNMKGLLAAGATVPTAATAGYAPGCIFVDNDAGAGLQLYINEGTAASCSFVPLAAGGVLSVTAALTLTRALHHGKTLILNNTTGFAVTLPLATGLGTRFRIIVGATISSGTMTIVTAGSDNLVGYSIASTDDAATTNNYWKAGSSKTTFSMDGTNRGGVIGDTIELVDVLSGKWAVAAIVTGTGTEATNFT